MVVDAVVKTGAMFSFAITRNPAVDAAISRIGDEQYLPVHYPGSIGAAVADQSAGQTQESEVVGSLAFVAANQAPEAAGPFQAAFDDVAVPAEPLVGR